MTKTNMNQWLKGARVCSSSSCPAHIVEREEDEEEKELGHHLVAHPFLFIVCLFLCLFVRSVHRHVE